MNGANKLVNAMKKVSQSNTQPSSDIVTVTVIDTNPLKFQLENNRLPISSDFYELSNLYNWGTVTEGQVFRAQTFNAGQKYYILEPYPLPANTNSGLMDERISTNRADINTLIPKVNTVTNQVTNLIGGNTFLSSDIYSTNEIAIGKWVDNKTIYRKVISANLGTLSSNWTNLVNAPSGIANLVNLYAICSQFNMPIYLGATYWAAFRYLNGKIDVIGGNGFDNYNVKIIIEYTKTTE